MVVINRWTPDVLLGFVVSNIPSSTIDQAIADFKLGAFEEYNPSVKLSLDQTRFIGFSPEQVRDELDAEDVRESFILLDAETTPSRSVWWVGRYLDEEIYSSSADQWRQGSVVNVSSDERILLKVRLATTDPNSRALAIRSSHSTLTNLPPSRAPNFYSNDSIGNTDIFENLPYPYDPHGPQDPCSVFDWEHDPPSPPAAYIVATPDEYEKSSEAEYAQKILLPTGAPTEVVRLKEGVARENNLQSEWTVAAMAARSEEGYPEGSLVFTQKWATRS